MEFATKTIHHILFKHPEENNMTYWDHLKRSWGFAIAFFVLGVQATIHGVLPCVFQTSSTDGIFVDLPNFHKSTMPKSTDSTTESTTDSTNFTLPKTSLPKTTQNQGNPTNATAAHVPRRLSPKEDVFETVQKNR